jgi:hypothetical protein
VLGTILGGDASRTRDGLPRDINDTSVEIGKLLESTRSKINGLTNGTTGTLINNLDDNVLLVAVVGDLHTLVAGFK